MSARFIRNGGCLEDLAFANAEEFDRPCDDEANEEGNTCKGRLVAALVVFTM